jgi:hypothetical protein
MEAAFQLRNNADLPTTYHGTTAKGQSGKRGDYRALRLISGPTIATSGIKASRTDVACLAVKSCRPENVLTGDDSFTPSDS